MTITIDATPEDAIPEDAAPVEVVTAKLPAGTVITGPEPLITKLGGKPLTAAKRAEAK